MADSYIVIGQSEGLDRSIKGVYRTVPAGWFMHQQVKYISRAKSRNSFLSQRPAGWSGHVPMKRSPTGVDFLLRVFVS